MRCQEHSEKSEEPCHAEDGPADGGIVEEDEAEGGEGSSDEGVDCEIDEHS